MRRLIHLPEPKVRLEVEARRKAGADILRPYIGRYVARKDEKVLVDADTPQEVLAWLRNHGIQGAAVFRVPVDPSVEMGLHGQPWRCFRAPAGPGQPIGTGRSHRRSRP